MGERTIVLVGDSPGIYVCAIYLHTSNTPFKLIRKNLSLQYGCQFVPGIPYITASDFNERCKLQAENMGIEVIQAKEVGIEDCGDTFRVNDGFNTYLTEILVLDNNIYSFKPRDNLFVISDSVRVNEAIDVAGSGCKTAFKVRAYLE
ncbi:hypothetical protein PAEPH01_0024 [Pancytospora epiphaga]|nr:hypothetical protein PAEPH01_0024 [Pancytospora epiphaga]